jgi:hypothetical protein
MSHHCDYINFRFGVNTKKKVIEAWNTRTPDLTSVIEKLEEWRRHANEMKTKLNPASYASYASEAKAIAYSNAIKLLKETQS